MHAAPLVRAAIQGAVVLALGLLTACYEPKEAPPNLAARREGIPLYESYNVTYRYLNGEQLEATLRAPYLREMPQKKRTEPITYADSGVVITFFDERERQKSRLRADWAVMHEHQGKAEARGNVVFIKAEGDTLETEKLRWLRRKERIETDAFVTITTPEEIIMGDSLVANTDFTEYTIYKIRGSINLTD